MIDEKLIQKTLEALDEARNTLLLAYLTLEGEVTKSIIEVKEI